MTAMNMPSIRSLPNSPRLAKATGNPRVQARFLLFTNTDYGRQRGHIAPEPRWSTIFATESPRQQMLVAAIIKQAPYSIPIGIRSGSVH
jgi:hypothetical protein